MKSYIARKALITYKASTYTTGIKKYVFFKIMQF